MMKATTKEFREFLLKQNAFALAVGVVIGAAARSSRGSWRTW
jgi:large-conductance mechanosensitive channel